MGILKRKDHPDTAQPPEPPPQPDPAAAAALDGWRRRVDELLERLDANDSRLDELEAGARKLLIAVEEGIQHVDRAERRVRAVVQRAQERLDSQGYEDPGVEAEAAALREFDGARGRAEGMQTVLEGVDDGGPDELEDWSGIPGVVRASELRELGL